MEDIKVKLILCDGSIGDEIFNFNLQAKATILEIKDAFSKAEGYTSEQLQITYRKPDLDVPLDDSDLIEDIDDQTGQFLIQCPSVATLDALVSIKYDEDVDVLVGTKKLFEHQTRSDTRVRSKNTDHRFQQVHRRL